MNNDVECEMAIFRRLNCGHMWNGNAWGCFNDAYCQHIACGATINLHFYDGDDFDSGIWTHFSALNWNSNRKFGRIFVWNCKQRDFYFETKKSLHFFCGCFLNLLRFSCWLVWMQKRMLSKTHPEKEKEKENCRFSFFFSPSF